jgi:hypothetical protein
MLYKPRFCCHCGDEIERVNWRFRDSRRFCDICETDHVLDDWAGIIACVIFMISFVTFYPSPPKTTEFEPGRIGPMDDGSIGRESSEASQVTSGSASPAVGVGVATQESRPLPKPTLEAFCGAITKKGTPCTRKVRKGERCWQHKVK